MLTTEQLCGLSNSHVQQIAGERDGIRLQETVAQAYQAMREAAAQAGVSIAIASAFRDFQRQRAIWNRKFIGEAPLYNDHGDQLDHQQLTTGEKIDAILTWSALPGASRHHWGTDFDVYDPRPFACGKQQLQLVPSEYQPSGPCHAMHQWLRQHAREFGFFFPYARYQGGVAAEPWHLSHCALATEAHSALSQSTLQQCLQQHDIQGKDYVLERLADIKQRYVDTICRADIAPEDVWFG